MSASKSELAERAARALKISALIETHGPLTCAEVSDKLRINKRSCASSLRVLVNDGTHFRVVTDERDSHSNRVIRYAPSGYTGKPAPQRKRGRNQVDVAKEIILASGRTESIDSSWLASVTEFTVPQASAVLRSMADQSLLEVERQSVVFGRKRNYYRVTEKIGSTPESIRNAVDVAMQSVAQAMAGWIPNASKRHELRGTA